MCVSLRGWCQLKGFNPYNCTFYLKYLELRFNKTTRTLASFLFALSLIIYAPVIIYVPALAFNQVTGVSVHAVSSFVCFICICYTCFGGLRAVVWTDVLQSCFTVGSVVVILVIGVTRVGGVSEIFRINEEGRRLEMFNMNPNPLERNTFWSVTIGLAVIMLSHTACHPGAVQRFISVSTFRNAKLVMLWAVVGFISVGCLVLFMGLLLYTNYHSCDPVATQMIKKPGQIFPLYAMEISRNYPGLMGLFTSGVLSAALSTMSAGLNTAAGTIYEDFNQLVLGERVISDNKKSLAIKLITVLLGLICFTLVFVAEKLGAVYQLALTLSGVCNGCLVGLFTLGVFFPRANAKGAISGAAASFLATATVVFGAQYYIARGLLRFPSKVTSVDGCPQELLDSLSFNASHRVSTYRGVGTPVVADDSVPLIFQLSYNYYCPLGVLVTLAVGLAISEITGTTDLQTLDPNLFTPCVRRFLPEKLQRERQITAEECKLVSTNNNPQRMSEPADDTETVIA